MPPTPRSATRCSRSSASPLTNGRCRPHVIDAIAAGQLQATGVLQDVGGDIPGGRAVALIDIDQDTSAYNLPGGAEAQVAVYTPFAHHFAIIRRILLRMKSWQNFVFLEGH